MCQFFCSVVRLLDVFELFLVPFAFLDLFSLFKKKKRQSSSFHINISHIKENKTLGMKLNRNVIFAMNQSLIKALMFFKQK